MLEDSSIRIRKVRHPSHSLSPVFPSSCHIQFSSSNGVRKEWTRACRMEIISTTLEMEQFTVQGELIYAIKDVDDLDRPEPTEALQEDTFLVYVVQ